MIKRLMLLFALLFALLWVGTVQAATFTISNQDRGTGHGFDADQAVAPIGGNDATTLGEQRLAVLEYAASIVTSRIASPVPIRISASFAGNNGYGPLVCDANSATLGEGGATNFTANFLNTPRADIAYPIALANALAGQRLADQADIVLTFNPSLDDANADCLQGSAWYYGLDGDTGANQIDLLSTAVHELLHGLGFQSLVALSDSNEANIGQFPQFTDADNSRYLDIFSTFIQDVSLSGQPYWPSLSVSERAASITNAPYLVWGSVNTASSAAGYLDDGLTQGRVELYAPDPIEQGSSVSHWATELAPDQIMEPFDTRQENVLDGLGMATCVLEDIGWTLANNTRCPDVDSTAIAGQKATATDEGDNRNDGDNDGGGGGGGCTVNPNAAFDPIWLVLIVLAAGVLYWRRRYRVEL